MKKFRLIAVALMCAAIAISCNKEVDYAENAAGGYSFNFTIAASGFDDTKADATVGWTSGEKVYVFFKPEGKSLLGGSNYVAFTYDGENWSPSSFIAPGALEQKGKMSAVYVPYLASTAAPVFADSNNSWTIDGGTVYYSCASAADYEVKNETVYGVLSLRIPDGYVQFVVDGSAAKDGDKLRCNYVDAYDCVTLNPDMNFSEDPAAGNLMTGRAANGKVYFWGKLSSCTDAKCKWTLTNSTGDVTMEVAADAVAKNHSYNLTSMPEIAMVQLWENGPYWSTVNLGATKPEETGDYYAWGEIEPYYEAGYAQEDPQTHWKTGKEDGYDWGCYKWYNSVDALKTKYCVSPEQGIVDNKTCLDLDDDAAHVIWGDKWRIPTRAEFNELIANTNQSEEVLNGVHGKRFTGKVAGFTDKSIFLPYAGYRSYTDFLDYGDGSYWTSSLNSSNSAAFIYLFPDYPEPNGDAGCDIGFSVRPIYADFIPVSTLSVNNVLSLAVGANEMLTAEVGPANATDRAVVWSSSNGSVADVTPEGMVHGISLGTATITAICGGKIATCTVTVEYPYVDLGLSVKWATFNVGATAPEEYGDYYAWGELEPYYEDGYAMELFNPVVWKTGKESGYDWPSYKWCSGSETTLTKYCTAASYGTVDGKTTLELADDVAYQKWGGDWHIPTEAEVAEFLANTTFEYTTLNSVEGMRYTSTVAGYTDKSVFLPAAGYRATDIWGTWGYGTYWTSSLYSDSPAYAFFFNLSNMMYSYLEPYGDRSTGCAIRPVTH